jgi:hypothetical protein
LGSTTVKGPTRALGATPERRSRRRGAPPVAKADGDPYVVVSEDGRIFQPGPIERELHVEVLAMIRELGDRWMEAFALDRLLGGSRRARVS